MIWNKNQISVFYGHDCNDLECVDGIDQACGNQSRVTWNSIPGGFYFILVHGWLTSHGDFRLTLSQSLEDDYWDDYLDDDIVSSLDDGIANDPNDDWWWEEEELVKEENGDAP